MGKIMLTITLEDRRIAHEGKEVSGVEVTVGQEAVQLLLNTPAKEQPPSYIYARLLVKSLPELVNSIGCGTMKEVDWYFRGGERRSLRFD